jgi:peptidoglycan/LPS O-acetylase OafA/YrhL
VIGLFVNLPGLTFAASVATQVFDRVIILALSLSLHLLVEKPARTWIRRSVHRVPNAIAVRRRVRPKVG